MKLTVGADPRDRNRLIEHLAKENIMPVKAPPWSKYPYTLRRIKKTEGGLIGTHFTGTETTAKLLEILVFMTMTAAKR